MITCKNCLEQYVASDANFDNHFRIHKNDNKTNKDRCGTAKHFNGMCNNNNNIFQFLSIQIIEQVCSNATDTEEILWHRKNMGKASYLPRFMPWTVWLASTVPSLRAIGNIIQVFVTNYF